MRKRKYNLNFCKNLALTLNREFLDYDYEGCDFPHKWKCNKCGNIFTQTIYKIINLNRRCGYCAGQNFDYKSFKLNLLNRNIEINDEFKNTKTKINCICLVCKCEWKATPNSLLHKKSGCPKCARNLLLSINDIKINLLQRNIKILNNEYKNSKTKLNCKCLICKCEWKATPNSLLHAKSGCPNCNNGFGEKATRFIFEKLFNKNFIKIRPNWLKYKNKLELDGYCEELNLAFEHNGTQHYKFCPQFHKSIDDFIEQQKKDQIKRVSCKKQKVVLIEINNKKRVNFNKLISIIKLELKKYKISYNEAEINEKDFYNTIMNS